MEEFKAGGYFDYKDYFIYEEGDYFDDEGRYYDKDGYDE